MSMLNVQGGVPLPEINRAPKKPRRKYPLDTMKVGDMFFVEGRTSKSVSAYISRIAAGGTGKFSARHCWMAKYNIEDGWEWRICEPTTLGAVEGTGVWRIE
jgi:hypothetical protein